MKTMTKMAQIAALERKAKGFIEKLYSLDSFGTSNGTAVFQRLYDMNMIEFINQAMDIIETDHISTTFTSHDKDYFILISKWDSEDIKRIEIRQLLNDKYEWGEEYTYNEKRTSKINLNDGSLIDIFEDDVKALFNVFRNMIKK